MRRSLYVIATLTALVIGVIAPIQSFAGPTASPGKSQSNGQGNGPCSTSGNSNSQLQSTKNTNKECLAAPAFTLSSLSETRTVNTPATGFTINSTGGAISSYSISPSAPSGMTFSSTTGAFYGTPTSVAASTTYTVTATNSTGSATRTFRFTVTAASSATYNKTTLREAAANNGSISETIIITLTNDLFTYYSGTDLTFGRVSNVPNGLTARLTPGSDRTFATLSFTGNALSHANVADISNLSITFFPGDFVLGVVPTGANRSDLAIDFNDPVTYSIGDTGPGGGIIFYFDSAGFNCGSNFSDTGSPTSGKCHYLEVAPNTWHGNLGDPRMPWAINEYTNISIPGATETAIGGGYKNSVATVQAIGMNFEQFAAGLARSYQNTTLGDWYLPSIGELIELQRNQQAVGLTSFSFWSSTENDATTAKDLGGYSAPGNGNKSTTTPIRPIRAF